MRNKKILTLKSLGWLSTTTIIATSLVSTAITLKNEDNNICLKTTTTNDSVSSTSATNIFNKNDEFDPTIVEGDIDYKITEQSGKGQVIIQGPTDSGTEGSPEWNFDAENVVFKDSIEISGATYNSIGIESQAFKDYNEVGNELSGDLKFSTANTYIGNEAFYNLPRLTSLDFTNADNLTEIGASAFENCSGISCGIEFPTVCNLKTIGERAFKDTNLTSVSIPGSVTALEENVFSGCENLTDVYLNWDEEQIGNVGSEIVIKKNWLADTGASNITIHVPAGLTTVYKENASNLGIEGFTIDDTLTYDVSYSNICKGAVSGTGTVRVTDGKAYIKSFNDLTSSAANEIEFVSSISFDSDIEYPLVGIDDSAFKGNANIAGTVIFPESITSIGANAFNSCTNIIRIDLPWGETSFDNIGENAFEGCEKLLSLHLSYTALLNFPVNNNFGIDFKEKTTVYADDTPADAVFTTQSEEEAPTGSCVVNKIADNAYDIFSATRISGYNLSINPQFTAIGDGAFLSNTNITGSFTIPSTVTKIGSEAFDGCTGIYQINLMWDTEEQIKAVTENIAEKWLGSLPEQQKLIINVPKDAKSIYEKYAEDLGISTCAIVCESNNALALGLGLGLGLGIPAVGATVGGTVYGVKKHKAKKQ